jgi:hypothetical protein
MNVKRLTVLFILAAVGAGCGTPGQVANGVATLPEDKNSALFIHRLSSVETVSENDALRGVLMLMDGEDSAETFQQRIDNLSERNILGSSWDFDATRALTRGRLAYMIYQATDIPGGVTLTLMGPSQRYCLRELRYRGMMGDGWLLGEVTGLEFISALSRADTYMQTGQVPNAAGAVD